MIKKIILFFVAAAACTLAAAPLLADVDLRINSAHIEDTRIYASQYARVTISLTNLAGDDVDYAKADVRFLTQPGNPGSSVGGVYSTLLSGNSVLRPGETANFSCGVSFLSTNTSGTYYLHIEVKPQTGIDPNTGNNTMSTDNAAQYIAPRSDGADVVILSCGFWHYLKDRNRPITGAVKYLNNSTVSAQNVTIRFYLSTDAAISESDMLLATREKGTLSSMWEQEESFEAPIDPDLPDGYYYGGAIISVSNDVDLSSNTARSGEIQIGDPGKFTTGGIRISFFPEEVKPLAAWRRVGTDKWFKHGEIESDLQPDPYVIEFKDVEGYKTPASRTVNVTLGNITGLLVSYKGSPNKYKPDIEVFRVVPSVVHYKETAWLIWKVDNAYSVTIRPKSGWHGRAVGSDFVRLKKSTTLKLTALYWVPDKWGNSIRYQSSSKARLRVIKDPEIKIFTSNSSESNPLHKSEPVKLYWSTGGALSLFFDINDDGIMDLERSRQADGELEFDMGAPGAVRLILEGSEKMEVSDSIQVNMTNQPVIRSFTITPQAAVAGEEVTLSWLVPGLENGTIDPLGVSITDTQGEYHFTADESMDLALHVANEFGEAEATRQLEVSETGTDLSLQLTSMPAESTKKNPIRIVGGSEYTADVTLINSGKENAGGFLVAMYAGDLLVDQKRITFALAPGKYEGIQLSYTPMSTGKVPLKVVVDPEKVIADFDRDNNTSEIYLHVEKPKEVRVAIGNIAVKHIGMMNEDHIVMLNFDVAQFGGKGKTEFYYNVLVYGSGMKGREDKVVARAEGILKGNLTKRRQERVTRLFRLDDEALDGRIEISIMNVKNTNGFIDLKNSRTVFIRSVMAGTN